MDGRSSHTITGALPAGGWVGLVCAPASPYRREQAGGSCNWGLRKNINWHAAIRRKVPTAIVLLDWLDSITWDTEEHTGSLSLQTRLSYR